MGGASLWPWAEQNQGFLTVLLFVAAAALTVVEVVRTVLAESRTERLFYRQLWQQCSAAALNACAFSLAVRGDEKEVWQTFNADYWQWRYEHHDPALNVMTSLRMIAPPDAILITAIDSALESLRRMPDKFVRIEGVVDSLNGAALAWQSLWAKVRHQAPFFSSVRRRVILVPKVERPITLPR